MDRTLGWRQLGSRNQLASSIAAVLLLSACGGTASHTSTSTSTTIGRNAYWKGGPLPVARAERDLRETPFVFPGEHGRPRVRCDQRLGTDVDYCKLTFANGHSYACRAFPPRDPAGDAVACSDPAVKGP